MRAMLDAQLVADRAALDQFAEEWDGLAVACNRPQMAPDWVLAWWRHIASADALPRLVAVRDGDRLVGIAPFYVEPSARRARVDYRLAGIELCGGLSPLAVAGREWEVAEAIGATLADATPKPDLIALEGLPIATHWPIALRDRWPGTRRPTLRQYHVHGSPLVSLRADSFDDWMAAKSSNFRGQMRRLRRAFAKEGGVSRISDEETLKQDVESLTRLHEQRWETLGSSNLVKLGERLPAMLEDAGRALLPTGRYRLRVLEIDGTAISAQLFLAAGDTVLYLNGGWDERFARLKPSMLGVLDAIEETFEKGERRIDLGVGEQSYKHRFSDGNDPVAWSIVIPPGPRWALTRAHTAPMLARYALRDAAKRALSAEQADKLRALRRRFTR
jgi:CelD/BcsL family acetyltransferase involved in cellulose biosynthesis